MDIKDLKIFQSVAYNESISKAAEQLNYVQSHITARIKLIESILNTQLFDRNSRGTFLNSDGKKLLVHAEEVLLKYYEMMGSLKDSENPSGPFDIGTVETVIKLPLILSTYNKSYPQVDLSLTTGVTDQLIQDTLSRNLDGAFVTGFDEYPGIIQHQVFDEELVLISSRENIPFEDLKNKPLLVFSSGCSFRANLEQWLHNEGIVSPKIMEFGTLETIFGSVVSGLGITLVPKSTVEQLVAKDKVQIHPIPKAYSEISTVFIRRADNYVTKPMGKFIETIEHSRHI